MRQVCDEVPRKEIVFFITFSHLWPSVVIIHDYQVGPTHFSSAIHNIQNEIYFMKFDAVMIQRLNEKK